MVKFEDFVSPTNKSDLFRMKMDRTIIRFVALGLLTILSLTGCAQSESVFSSKLPLGSMWEVFVEDDGEVDWDSASPVAQEQHAGYTLAGETLDNYAYNDIYSSEGNQQDDVQIAIREMVENEDDPVVAVIGATTNEATMRAASLVNFFNVPMIVPSAVGDNLLPSNNLWAFRLSAPGSAYANYLFGSLLTKADFGIDTENTNASPKLNIAILYEGNTFGESAAVATARAAKQLGIGIGVYANFPPDTPDPARLNILLNAVKDEGVHLVYLVSSDPAVAKTLAQLFKSGFEPITMPVLVGQAGGFASMNFLESPVAERIYVIRQKLVTENCPANVKSLFQAQTYAAVFLVDQAIQEAERNQLTPEWYEFNFNKEDTNELAAFREVVRDIIKQTDSNLPCVGPVAFDNAGGIKIPLFELIVVKNGEIQIDPIDDFVFEVEVETLLDSYNE
jgi:ABC-type branched-subunit amino acid transport system substrate-binding protein